jgi:hypothetical protein
MPAHHALPQAVADMLAVAAVDMQVAADMPAANTSNL